MTYFIPVMWFFGGIFLGGIAVQQYDNPCRELVAIERARDAKVAEQEQKVKDFLNPPPPTEAQIQAKKEAMEASQRRMQEKMQEIAAEQQQRMQALEAERQAQALVAQQRAQEKQERVRQLEAERQQRIRERQDARAKEKSQEGELR